MTKDYIRAEGDVHKENVVERTNKAEIRPEEQSERAGVVGRMFGMKYS